MRPAATLPVAAETGLSVPRNMPLSAWDGSQPCQLTRPALSEMSHDVGSFGAEAANALPAVLDKQAAT